MTTSTDEELLTAAKKFITYCVVTDPHNIVDTVEFMALADDIKHEIITDYMKDKGFRSITPEEYVEEKAYLEAHRDCEKNMTLWRRIGVYDPIDSGKERPAPTPIPTATQAELIAEMNKKTRSAKAEIHSFSQ